MKPWICLLGLRSSGKTTIGKTLASQLSWKFFDIDQLLVEQEGKSISELFEIFGESHFRVLETQCLFSLTNYNLVLSTGGGMIENREGMKYIRKRATCIYLDVSLEILIERRKNDPGDRPRLFGARNIEEEYVIALERRSNLLKNAADLVLQIDQDTSALDICERIRRGCGIQ